MLNRFLLTSNCQDYVQGHPGKRQGPATVLCLSGLREEQPSLDIPALAERQALQSQGVVNKKEGGSVASYAVGFRLAPGSFVPYSLSQSL